MVLKSGKEEIVYLLNKVIDKYKIDTGKEIVQNTNRKNYEAIAILLSDISNEFPTKWSEFDTHPYEKERNSQAQTYPYRKYDITGGQIKDALNGIVAHPRPFLVDACYVYLYGMGRLGFEKNPKDENLLVHQNTSNHEILNTKNSTKTESAKIETIVADKKHSTQNSKIIGLSVILFLVIIALLGYNLYTTKNEMNTLKFDMNILPYKPTKAEIDSLEGIWLCYTGSPQARISDPNRFHKVVPNLLNIKYKNGYFTFTRYGASFNHVGYMQFESPGIVSIFSKINNGSSQTASPRHSLLDLNKNQKFVAAISASWNFDVGEKNKIIGIREVFVKLGKGGTTTEILNDLENASCNCKVIKWMQPNNTIRKIYLKNTMLDSLNMDDLKSLIDEKSILENFPNDKLILKQDSVLK